MRETEFGSKASAKYKVDVTKSNEARYRRYMIDQVDLCHSRYLPDSKLLLQGRNFPTAIYEPEEGLGGNKDMVIEKRLKLCRGLASGHVAHEEETKR